MRPALFAILTQASGPSYDPAVQAYLAAGRAAGGTISDADALAVDAFVKGCVADGTWSTISDLGILASWSTFAAAIKPLKTSAGITSLNASNFTSAHYLARGADCGVNNYRELAAVGGGGGATTRLLDAGAIGWATNAAIGVFGSNAPTGSWPWFYAGTAGFWPQASASEPYVEGGTAAGYGGNDYLSSSPTAKRAVGDLGLVRSSGAALRLVQAGAALKTAGGTSTAAGTGGNFNVCGGSSGQGAQTRLYYYAPGMTFAQYQSFYTRVTTMLAAFGVGTSTYSYHYQGDSIMAGFGGVTRLDEYLRLKTGWDGRHMNVARSGELMGNASTTGTIAYAYAAGGTVGNTKPFRPDGTVWTKGFTFIEGGTNDLAAGTLGTTVASAHTTLSTTARGDGFKTIGLTPPRRYDAAWTGAMETQRMACRAAIMASASSYDFVADMDSIWPTSASLQSDGIHPTSAANSVLADYFAANINPATL